VRKSVKIAFGTVSAAALAGLGAGCAGGSTSTVARTVVGPAVTKTDSVPGPTVTRTVVGPTVTETHSVPGPTVTVTQTVSAPPPPAGSVIDTFEGAGNEATPAFNVPDSGDYVVIWSYSGNNDPSLGGPTNFSISENGSGLGADLPNDIASSGQGSTEITGAGSTDSLDVQATGSWVITIKSAS
jgi:hypothetical protein